MAATGEVRVPETFGGRVIGSPEGAGARRVIFHSDMNAFYASVEQAERPELRGVPLVVGGHEELRHGIVLAKSAQAKAAGVKTGEALWEARAKCPGLVVVPPRYEVYQAYSAMARRIYYQYTDLVEPFGLDEAWLDLTGSLPLLGGDPARTAAEISGRIKAELGCTVSVGVSWNKIFAKFGSDFRKPDAITFITPQNYRCRVWEAPVSELLYVGAATRAKLHSSGIDRIGELACASPELLRRRLGKIGLVLRAFARGEDATPVKPYDQARNEVDRTVKSFGNGLTAPHDIVSASDAKALVYLLSESVAQRLREARFRASTVSIGVRSARDLASYSRQTTLRRATNVTGIVARTAWGLLAANEPLDGEHPLRGLHVRASNLEPCDAPQQLELAFDARRRMLEDLDGFHRLCRRPAAGFGPARRGAAGREPAGAGHQEGERRASRGLLLRLKGGEGRVVLLRGGRALPVILGKRRGLRLPLRMTTCGPFDARRAEAGAKGEPWQFFKGSSTSSGRLVFARQAFLGRRGGRATVFGREIVRALNLRPIGPAADEASGEERGSAGWRGERGHGAGHSGAAEAVCGGGSDVPRRWAHRAARRNLA